MGEPPLGISQNSTDVALEQKQLQKYTVRCVGWVLLMPWAVLCKLVLICCVTLSGDDDSAKEYGSPHAMASHGIDMGNGKLKVGI